MMNYLLSRRSNSHEAKPSSFYHYKHRSITLFSVPGFCYSYLRHILYCVNSKTEISSDVNSIYIVMCLLVDAMSVNWQWFFSFLVGEHWRIPQRTFWRQSNTAPSRGARLGILSALVLKPGTLFRANTRAQSLRVSLRVINLCFINTSAQEKGSGHLGLCGEWRKAHLQRLPCPGTMWRSQ